jgi:hypothetical protein
MAESFSSRQATGYRENSDYLRQQTNTRVIQMKKRDWRTSVALLPWLVLNADVREYLKDQ